jgi:soluble lytic murein transglycosylase
MAGPTPSDSERSRSASSALPLRFFVTRAAAAVLVLLLFAGPAFADIGTAETTAEEDAEFARAADLLEAGQRSEAESALQALRSRAHQPAWDARVALLLAADDVRRRDYAAAALRLDMPASSIGLEPYRELFRAQALELAGDSEGAIAAAKRAAAFPGPFAYRVEAATLLARLLEDAKRTREAAEALAAVAGTAAPADAAPIAIARIRLALALHDPATVREAARALLLDAPTADAARSTPAWARSAAAEAERSLTPSERGRRGSALVAANDPRRGVRLLLADRPSAWPDDERNRNLLALARGELSLKKPKEAEAAAARIPDDGSLESSEARLLRCDIVLARLRKKGAPSPAPGDPRFAPTVRALESLEAPAVPASVRAAAAGRLVRLLVDEGDFDAAVSHARIVAEAAPGTTDGFEPLWLASWKLYLAGDYAGARARFETLASLYDDVSRDRRLSYWRARCLATEGRRDEATAMFGELVAAHPPDIYARFARAKAAPTPASAEPLPPLGDPSTQTAAFARVDELVRLRRFEEAAAEARRLPPSRGRELRLAQADFALGRFSIAAIEIKRAIPELGTAQEGRVPEAWRRIYYPIEEGGILATRAREFGLDPAVLRGLVRQESVFDAHVKSHAGAVGLMQLMPSTAKGLAKAVLHTRYRGGAFLYDPGVNASLGAAYFKRLLEEFDGSTILALAAYNGGPGRVARIARENPRLSEDELFESIPIYETRDYVRRVLLYSESYRELYP